MTDGRTAIRAHRSLAYEAAPNGYHSAAAAFLNGTRGNAAEPFHRSRRLQRRQDAVQRSFLLQLPANFMNSHLCILKNPAHARQGKASLYSFLAPLDFTGTGTVHAELRLNLVKSSLYRNNRHPCGSLSNVLRKPAGEDGSRWRWRT